MATSPQSGLRSFQGHASSWPRLSLRLHSPVAFLGASIYAIVLVSLPLLDFKDRANYLAYAEYPVAILQAYVELGPAALLSNEPLWLAINIVLASFLAPEDVVRVIIFVPAFVVAWITLQSSPKHVIWLMLVLLYPVVIKNHIIHLRQGVAVALFLAGLALRREWLRYMLIGATPFIHSSFFFVIGIGTLAQLSRRLRFATDLFVILFVLVTLAVVLSLEGLASVLGARQANQYDLRQGTVVSGAGFVLWLAVLILMMLEGKCYLRQHRFAVAVILFYLGTYFFVPITARVFESMLIPVLLAGLALTRWRGVAFKVTIASFGLVLWLSGYASTLLVTTPR
ncbi:MAG: hypothetical protein KatS3mg053_0523 [Candidatus Roseilinea sp.]|nr:MAG: hypothetical protein KatS3mg053_0523 [Candidatus Roseilinea sp.]